MRSRLEKGQAIILVLVSMALFLMAALGLAIDGSHLYAQRQMAQSAADAAARAAIFSIFSKTNTDVSPTNYKNDFGSSDFTCNSGTTNLTPCYFASQGGFSPANGDTVAVKFPTSVPGVTLSRGWSPGPGAFPAAVQVTVIRNVQASLMRFLGPSTPQVAAQATAAIVQIFSPVPILVLHPSLPQSFSRGGNSSIQICGGPKVSVQVNSTDSGSVVDGGGGTVDLSKAGPKATIGAGGLPNCDGQGADFDDKGGPNSYPGTLLTGTDGTYRQPAGPIYDPLRDVPTPPIPPPPIPPPAPVKLAVSNGVDGCPPAPLKPCMLYQPGLYIGGITQNMTKNETSLFAPGLYYMLGGGFHGGANSTMLMAQCGAPPRPTDVPPLPQILRVDPDFGCGMMVYSADSTVGSTANDIFEVGANGGATLLGSNDSGTYKGILFFEAHTAAAHTGVSGSHKLGGGGNLSLTGTIYLTDTTQTSSTYQELVLRGNSGNTTDIIGEIIVDVLNLGGSGQIRMFLNPNYVLPVDQVALVK